MPEPTPIFNRLHEADAVRRLNASIEVWRARVRAEGPNRDDSDDHIDNVDSMLREHLIRNADDFKDIESFCDQCGGPFTEEQGGDPQYNGHWDTCPNRWIGWKSPEHRGPTFDVFGNPSSIGPYGGFRMPGLIYGNE